jgi:hypothetical protein
MRRREFLITAWTGATSLQTAFACTDKGGRRGSIARSAADYGFLPDATPQANLAALKRAIAETPSGSRLIIPAAGGRPCHVDTSGGLSRSVVIDRPMILQCDGHVRATDGARRANPPYLFHVKSGNVTIEGRGTLSGSGQVDDANVPEDKTFPGLIFVSGDDFRLLKVLVDTPPKVGVHLWDCWRATISARWRGGVRKYRQGGTSHFAIRATGGGGHRIVNNQFGRDAHNGRVVTAFFSGGWRGGATANIIHGNTADVHEKLAYLFGDKNMISDCTVKDALHTDVIRINGNGNSVRGIVASNIRGGVAIYDGSHNEVRGCRFTGVRQTGIYLSQSEGYRGVIDDNRLIDNRIDAAPGADGLQDGILVDLHGASCNGVQIAGNVITGFGRGGQEAPIRARAPAASQIHNAVIERNTVQPASGPGISVRGLISPRIADNLSNTASGRKIRVIDP